MFSAYGFFGGRWKLHEKISALNVESEALEVLLKMVFGLRKRDSAERIQEILKTYREQGMLMLKERRGQKEVNPTVDRVINNHNMIPEYEHMETSKPDRGMCPLKLYLDLQRIQIANRNRSLKSDSFKVRIEQRTIVYE